MNSPTVPCPCLHLFNFPASGDRHQVDDWVIFQCWPPSPVGFCIGNRRRMRASRLGVRAGGVAGCADGLLVIAPVQAPTAAEQHGCLEGREGARFQAASSDQYRGIVVACFGWRNHHRQRFSGT